MIPARVGSTKRGHCPICMKPYRNENMVECTNCKKWCCYECVNVTDDIISDENWLCPYCSPHFNQHSPSASMSTVVVHTSHQNKAFSSKRSSKSRTSQHSLENNKVINNSVAVSKKTSSSKRKLRLRLLQEELALLKKERELTREARQLIEESDDSQELDDEEVNAVDPLANTLLSLQIEKRMENVEVRPTNTVNIPKSVSKGSFKYKPTHIPSLQLESKSIEPKVVKNWEQDHKDLSYEVLEQTTLTPQQCAARKTTPKELPAFNGNSHDWPLFISSYRRSTQLCGFDNTENLLRLQKCLKGTANSAVRSLLAVPECVPQIISTLEILFGRPEQVLEANIDLIRRQPPPKPDKLETVVEYALSIKNLCISLKTANMNAYLNNPSLMHELVEKLPPQIKVNWAIYRSTLQHFSGLKDFSDWMYNMAMNVCTALPSLAFTDRRLTRQNERSNVHAPEFINKQAICKICGQGCTLISDCKKFQEYSITDKWEMVRNLKLCKLCLKRHRFPCKYPVKCTKNECQRKHHPLLHKDVELQMMPANSNPVTVIGSVQAEANNISFQNNHPSIRFRILPVKLKNEDKEVFIYAFMDEGSSITMLDETIAEELGLCGDYEPLCLKWTGAQERIEERSQRIKITISGNFYGAPLYTNRPARTVKALHLPQQTLNATKLVEAYPYLKNIPIASYKNANPRILIGLDNWELALPLKVKEGEEGQPIAAKCRLGWTVFASQNRSNDNLITAYHICECNCTNISNQELHETIKKYFSVESLGVTPPIGSVASKELKRACEIMDSTSKQVGNRYEIGLLWKYDKLRIPNSSKMAFKRLKCIEKRMNSDPDLALKMNQQIQDFIQKGYIRKLTPEELKQQHERIWYLPIFPVFNPNKPGKFRIVWDAAAEVDGISLNNMLLKGNDQLASLFGILLRFRERKIGFSADIREMFLRVRMRNEDQHAQRFFWRDGNPNNPVDTYVMTVMTFGATCSPSCAQHIKNLNARKFSEEYPRATKSILENHYVDDLLDSADNVQEALDIAKQVTMIHSTANFEIRNWCSNSKMLMQTLNTSAENPVKINMNMESEETTEKVLGMWWNLDSDCFTYSLRYNKGNKEVLQGKERPTKREVLRILMSIYDPLGLIANFLIYLKILLQEIWRSKIDWDDTITDEQFEKWLLWLNYLPKVETLTIPRCYLNSVTNWEGAIVELHVFVDASENATACVAYLRIQKEKTECTLVGAKTRVAPIKIQTIPRLELDAAIIGSRFANNISQHLSISISRTIYWSDSITVLRWIRTDDPRKLGKSVAYRVAEIQEISMISNWRYIPTKLNVADEATKWSKQPTLIKSSRWFTGPEFLYEDEEFWPVNENTLCQTQEEFTTIHECNQPVIDMERFSSYHKLLNTMATGFRFIHLTLAKLKNQTKPAGNLTSEELRLGEIALIRMTQKEYYSEEIKHLQRNETNTVLQPIVNKSSSIYKLSPYLDSDKILRVRGRIDAAYSIKIQTKRPIILPRESFLTLLIIRNYHKIYQHCNHEIVVNEIRQKFHVPKLRRTLLKIRRECQTCKIRLAKPTISEMSPLPEYRLSTYTAPFTYTAVDYFGPINVMVGRRVEKRWGALFSCLTTRAVHMEMAYKLDADSFILCLKNLMNRRGRPQHIHCDRGTNFVAAERVLRNELQNLDPQLVAKSFVSPQMSFHFNSPLSPHMGGAWERLVKAVKIALHDALPTRTPTDPLLISCLIAAENIVNSRPLTYLPLDSEESEALTPNHFLVGSSSGDKPIGQLDDHAKVLKYNYLYREKFANRYWQRFVAEYLPELLLRSKWHQQTRPLKEGDLVLICDKDLPRCNWPKGRIIEVLQGKDGQVRRAKVQTATGIYERPAVKLAVLSVAINSKDGPARSFGSAVPGEEC